MTQLQWSTDGERFFEAGLDRGVLYVGNASGEAWSGLIAVSEEPDVEDTTSYYIDGIKYNNSPGQSEFAATITAFSSPPGFARCVGELELAPGLIVDNQPRVPFGLTYRTRVGNDVVGPNYGYKLHLVYEMLASPTVRPNQTLTSEINPSVLSWAITTRAPILSFIRPSAHLVVDSRTTDRSVLRTLESWLYGSEFVDARLPTQRELVTLFGG